VDWLCDNLKLPDRESGVRTVQDLIDHKLLSAYEAADRKKKAFKVEDGDMLLVWNVAQIEAYTHMISSIAAWAT
jgi:hypothetical protein